MARTLARGGRGPVREGQGVDYYFCPAREGRQGQVTATRPYTGRYPQWFDMIVTIRYYLRGGDMVESEVVWDTRALRPGP